MIRKLIIATMVSVVALFVALHLVVGSRPVQDKILAAMREALAEFGIILEVESIDFATFMPEIYLNRVKLSTLKTAPVHLNDPLSIDKIKVAVNPLALLRKEISITEATLFHPKINIPQADKLYKVLVRRFSHYEPVSAKGGDFEVVLHRIGVVDALFNVEAQKPRLGIRSPSLTVFVGIHGKNSQSISVQSGDMQLQREGELFDFSHFDIDIEVSKKLVDVRKANLEGPDFSIDVKGTTSLPLFKNGKGPRSINANYNLRLPLSLVKKIPEIKLPEAHGRIVSSGSIKQYQGNYTGSGGVKYEKISIQGYNVGTGQFEYRLKQRTLILRAMELLYAGANLRSKRLKVDLDYPAQVSGKLEIDGFKLQELLAGVKVQNAPVRMNVDGSVDLSGQLQDPFRMDLDIKGQIQNLYSLKKDGPGPVAENVVVHVPKGKLLGRLSFLKDRMEYTGEINALGGQTELKGFVGFGKTDALVEVRAKNLDLFKLNKIAELELGGTADLLGNMRFTEDESQVSGKFDVKGAEISQIVLGSVSGDVDYSQNLLRFSSLKLLTDLEPAWGNGVVDFRPAQTRYEFKVGARRVSVNKAFSIFEKKPLSISAPSGGETSLDCLIYGGGEEPGFHLRVNGEARNFKWYDERWLSGRFSLSQKDGLVDLHRAILRKRRGQINLSGQFGGDNNQLWVATKSLPVSELSRFGAAPLKGTLWGELQVSGKWENPSVNGSIRWQEATFRNKALKDGQIDISTEQGKTQLQGYLNGGKLKGKWERALKTDSDWDMSLEFNEYDVLPLLTYGMQKDVPTLNEMVASGNLSLQGRALSWETFRGEGRLSQLFLGQKGAPMRSSGPVEFRIAQGFVTVDRFHLVGRESQLSFDLKYEPGKSVQSNLDGKVDLQFLQPFIPGLEYGSGKVSLGLRVSGKPDQFDLFGNMALEDGAFRLQGINDQFRNTQAQLSMSQNRINVDKLVANVGGGNIYVKGDVRIARFQKLVPHLEVSAYRVGLRLRPDLSAQLTGEFQLLGDQQPFDFKGKCEIHEARLTNLESQKTEISEEVPLFQFDLDCQASKNLWVDTDLLKAEFAGNLGVRGTSNQIGLLGQLDSLSGDLFFRDKKFSLTKANVKFESETKIVPRFDVTARTVVRERINQAQEEYEINLAALGVPEDYRIVLSSSPPLPERDIINLLVLGSIPRDDGSGEGSYVDFGTALVGQVPIQKKIENELGVKIGIDSTTSQSVPEAGSEDSSNGEGDRVASVKIEKDITDKTTLSYSNTIEGPLLKEIRIEQLLNDKFTINGSVVDKRKGSSQNDTIQSYGLDIRYRFQFE